MSEELTDEERQKVADWINSKAPLVGKCPVCGDRKWSVLPHLVYAPTYSRNGIILGGPSYPNAGLICGNCGNTQYINAVMMGLVQTETDKREKNTAKKQTGEVVP